MYYIELNEKKYPTDASGYLTHLADWSEDLAIEIAKKEHIELTDEHWEIIFLVRDFYQEYKTSPAIRMLVKAMAQKFGEEKGNSRYLQRLFPDGPAKQATKIAGLPKPIKCL
ncbi:TusE/DsrC/DsvC family sulfur relay protein [Actinobacillus pleuropneumoniae]|uniref:Sulfurtransferase n=1 Tax=Actinobacillus pleuropneumoniae TaxID=715 RepID=A0A9Q4H626_ACTPL|nr:MULTISPECIES: TusE/DsrC/DsvC family sulfur relay protein [Actinobacillus]MCL7720351.1 TusE/DsrC/DsvC family sulfur relay protein [Actinobacillus pleuropneumoniae]MCL7727523.1 TusE/DsrC/DsvC family sulfur relay protein [Actinobacillus pleuropneumoniae]MCL7728961.1 TusE/DsrC/DsvC family sulfur relay protein [Actinobacillus pleuropneumoniae]MCY6367179.1 TusE/DsrC/DsvC family sulfur relay protein [Actinobacillus pleuropneumoniae]MCY6384045.1 TusE/DsrC/DsvC family sulfur relay protein [Actinobac